MHDENFLHFYAFHYVQIIRGIKTFTYSLFSIVRYNGKILSNFYSVHWKIFLLLAFLVYYEELRASYYNSNVLSTLLRNKILYSTFNQVILKFRAPNKWITSTFLGTATNWTVVYNFTFGVIATNSNARILTFQIGA